MFVYECSGEQVFSKIFSPGVSDHVTSGAVEGCLQTSHLNGDYLALLMVRVHGLRLVGKGGDENKSMSLALVSTETDVCRPSK